MSENMNTHLDWSSKQGRILTGGGRAEELYTAERGYSFEESELPHYHLGKGETRSVFTKWKKKRLAGSKRKQDGSSTAEQALVGTWTRLLFFGGWEHTSSKDERTFNLQTRNLFIDLRVPRTRDALIPKTKTSLQELTKEELRCFARQHVFAGYTQMTTVDDGELLCTRHHCIDWNFVGCPRPRPNKWYAELQKEAKEVQTWKEWAFAKDERGQHYYCEQWQREGEGSAPMLALRKQTGRDGILLIVGDHFNYILARDLNSLSKDKQKEYSPHSSLVALVDAALHQNDLATALAYLSIQGGHGRISKGWRIDCAIEPWKEGTPLLQEKISVQGERIGDCQVVWKEDVWEVFDTTLTSTEDIRAILNGNRSKL